MPCRRGGDCSGVERRPYGGRDDAGHCANQMGPARRYMTRTVGGIWGELLRRPPRILMVKKGRYEREDVCDWRRDADMDHRSRTVRSPLINRDRTAQDIQTTLINNYKIFYTYQT